MNCIFSRPVAVTTFRFTKEFEVIPRRIELDGVSYDLTNEYSILPMDGGSAVDVSDGTRWFRLLYSAKNTWQLLRIAP